MNGLTWGGLLSVAEVAEISRVASELGCSVQVAVTEHWVCCRFPGVAEDGPWWELGMWRSTGQWFEADENGAMGDEPITVTPRSQPTGGRQLVFSAHVADPDVDLDALCAALKPHKAEGMTGTVWATAIDADVPEVAGLLVLLDAAHLDGPLADVMRLSPQAQEARELIEARMGTVEEEA